MLERVRVLIKQSVKCNLKDLLLDIGLEQSQERGLEVLRYSILERVTNQNSFQKVLMGFGIFDLVDHKTFKLRS